MPRIIVGLPALSRGPLLDMAKEIGAPIMISATALAKWQDDGPCRSATNSTRSNCRSDARRATRDHLRRRSVDVA